jgi:hypothetical protein
MSDLDEGLIARHLPNERLGSLRDQLLSEHYRVFELSGVSNRVDFVRVIKERLPLDPPIHAGGWDAIEDSLSSALIDLPGDRFAIIWHNANVMMESEPEEFLTVESVLSDAASSLAGECGKILRIFFMGDGRSSI